MSASLLLLLLSLSVSGSLIILLISVICIPMQKKYSQQWQYYIWLVAIVRLLLPFSPSENLMVYLSRHLETMTIASDVSSKPENNHTNNNSEIPASTIADTSRTWDKTRDNQKERTTKNDVYKTIRSFKALIICMIQKLWIYRQYLYVLWLMTAMLLLLRKITVYQDFVRFVRAGSTPVDDISYLDELSETAARLGIHKAVDLWSSKLISSPMLIGFRHPHIVLPESSFTKPVFHYTVLHELMHYKRRDMYYKWLVQLTLCIHWFNPFVYVMARHTNRLCELSCDEAVIACLKSDSQRRAYAATLLAAMPSEHTYREKVASITLTESKKQLKERMEFIMKKRQTTFTKKLAIAVLSVSITATGIFSGCLPAGASAYQKETAKPSASAGAATINTVDTNRKKESIKKQTTDNNKNDEITKEQADKMALALTNKIWVWEWVEFFVPYMSQNGADKLVSASKHSEWAGYVDQTSGKKLKFTKKQVSAARKHKPSELLTCKDIDSHALMIMQSNGDWDCISFMLPYMSRNGIRSVTRCYNSKHSDDKKRAADYYEI